MITNVLLVFLVCLVFIGICEVTAIYDVVRTNNNKREDKGE